LVLSDDDQIISHIACDPPIGNSDHCTTKLLIKIENDEHNQCTDVIETTKTFNYWHDADFNAIGRYLDSIDWHALV